MNTSSLIRAVVLFLLLFSLCPTQSVRSQVLQSNQVEVVEVTKSENRQGDSNNASDSKQKQIVVMNLFYDGLDQDFLDKLMYYFGVWMQSGFNDFLLVIDSSGGDLDTGIAAYNYCIYSQ
jgi:ATP-dependent protease ClpP protease subunit